MKKRMKKLFVCVTAAVLVLSMSMTSAFGVSYSDFKDVKGHWAEEYLKKAVADGILKGTTASTLEPDGTLTGSQMAAMLVRSCRLQHYTSIYPGSDTSKWYRFEAAIAYSAGILPEDASVNMDAPVKRSQVFLAVKNAFFKEEAAPQINDPAEDPLAAFPDAGKLAGEEKDAAGLLISKNVLRGDDLGRLNPGSNIKRGEFAALLYRAKEIGTPVAEAGSEEIKNLKIKITAPAVAPGGKLTATAVITGVGSDFTGAASWRVDRKLLSGYSNPAKVISEGAQSSCSMAITFERNMALQHDVSFLIEYEDPNTGRKTCVVAETAVRVNNYPDSHYQDIINKKALNTVSSKYSGSISDYSTEIKEAFVNVKGYSSPNRYLIWVNRATQRVNVFDGSKGKWKLIHTFRCATGKSSTPTPVGVTYITAKQSAWKTSSYIVRPISRFYPNSGYAFHSVLYVPSGSGKVKDGTLGKPASHGCVRTDEEGVWWIYRNAPVKTTVVIY